MIILTRLGGHELAVNPDLIERAEPTPDTVLTMADGHKIIVAESLAELVTRVRHWRAQVAAEAYLVARGEVPRGDERSIGDLAELHGEDAVMHNLPTSNMARVVRMPQREI